MNQDKLFKWLHPLAGSRLSVLSRVVSENGVNSVGWKQFVTAAGCTALGAPIRVYERMRHGRAIANQKLDPPPVFIIGHWRSGTTNMHNHLLQDPQFGHLSLLQCLLPWGNITLSPLLRRALQKSLPATRPMDGVQLGLDEPMSEDFALGAMTDVSHYHGYYFPRQGDSIFRRTILFEGLSEKEIAQWQETYRYLLQKVALANGGRQLLLKNPAHSGRIPTLLKMFPNAKFIHVYRNPFVVVASTMKLMDRFLNLFSLQQHDWNAVQEDVLQRYQMLMQRLFRDKELIPQNQLLEVSHEEMTKHPLEVLQRIYSHLNLPGFDTAQPQMANYVQSMSNYETNRYKFDDATVTRWTPFLQASIDRWGYTPPADKSPRANEAVSVSGS